MGYRETVFCSSEASQRCLKSFSWNMDIKGCKMSLTSMYSMYLNTSLLPIPNLALLSSNTRFYSNPGDLEQRGRHKQRHSINKSRSVLGCALILGQIELSTVFGGSKTYDSTPSIRLAQNSARLVKLDSMTRNSAAREASLKISG